MMPSCRLDARFWTTTEKTLVHRFDNSSLRIPKATIQQHPHLDFLEDEIDSELIEAASKLRSIQFLELVFTRTVRTTP